MHVSSDCSRNRFLLRVGNALSNRGSPGLVPSRRLLQFFWVNDLLIFSQVYSLLFLSKTFRTEIFGRLKCQRAAFAVTSVTHSVNRF